MSGLLMGMAFYVLGVSMSERLTLLALCDHATDLGERVFPTVHSLAQKTQLKDRVVQYNLKRLESLELICRMGKGGRGIPNEFRLNVGALRASYERVHPVAPFPEKKGAVSDPERVQSSVERVQSGVEKGAKQGALRDTSVEPSKKRQGRAVLTDVAFIATLKRNPAYQGIDVDREMGKLDAWLLTPRGRGKQKTRQRVVAWLNNVDRPMGTTASDPYAKFPGA